jgi:hypothetical protein
LKFERLQNKFLGTIGNFARGTLVLDLHVAFKIRVVYDFVTKLSRQQAEVILKRHNLSLRNIEQRKKYKRLKPGGEQTYDRSRDKPAVAAKANLI